VTRRNVIWMHFDYILF